jgi:hypothetical protein
MRYFGAPILREAAGFRRIQLGMNRAYYTRDAANGHADAFGLYSATISPL